jgi:acetyl esterase/lipase
MRPALFLDFIRPPDSRHRYGPHRSQRADLHLPDRGGAPYPLVILIHGGSWRARYGRRMMRGLARDLTGRGRAVWNIEYRRMGLGQGGGWPTTLEDVGAAIDHLADAGLPVDLEGVVVIGYSAGGQLALWAASRDDSRVPIRRVAAQAGVCNMAGTARDDPDSIVRRFLGGGPDDVPDRYAAADPMQRVPLGIDTLLVHGEDDETVLARRSREYAAAARAAGDQIALVELPATDHRAHIDPRSEAWGAVVEWLEHRT